jgi:2',3'-cyclic-nucleotide 2'-phosphodiesterase (5'-nucleotidase family)
MLLIQKGRFVPAFFIPAKGYLCSMQFFFSHLLSRIALMLALLAGVSCKSSYQTSQIKPYPNLEVAANTPSDTAMERVIQPYKDQLGKQMNQVIGTAPQELAKNPGESLLGNFVADLMLVEAEKQGQRADISVLTNGGLRTSLPKGNITVGNVFELMPFENELGIVEITGAQLRPLFDMAAGKRTVPVGNARFTVNSGKAIDISIGKEPLQDDKKYLVAVSDYLASGGDNMTFLKEAGNFRSLNITVRDAIMRHIKNLTAAGKPVTARLDGRIQVAE